LERCEGACQDELGSSMARVWLASTLGSPAAAVRRSVSNTFVSTPANVVPSSCRANPLDFTIRLRLSRGEQNSLKRGYDARDYKRDKDTHPTMRAEINRGSNKEISKQSTLGHGCFIKGKWCCEYGQTARCLTTKKGGPNKGSKCMLCLILCL
jgi:hypothetical protein